MRRIFALAATSLVACVAAGPAVIFAAADAPSGLGLRACQHGSLRCGTLTVPRDRPGAGAARLRLAVAAQPRRRAQRGVLVALSGGPGQSSVAAAASFASVLSPLLGRKRLVLLDQRGTGAGALRCPALQRLGSLAPVAPPAVGACARRLGPARASFTTLDTVADVEALRRALRAPRITLYGVSYGTYVALQYARVHPDRVEALVLDSAVGPDGVDPYLLDTLGALPRVLREGCRAGAGCRALGITPDPVADVGVLARRLSRGPISAVRYDGRGRRRSGQLRSADELLNLLVAGDLNPYLQAALPGAVRSAVSGDAAPLVRLRGIADGPPTRTSELSVALNVATTCQDTVLPYGLDDPVSGRAARAQQALAGVPAARFAPFDRASVLAGSLADFCRAYPVTTVPPAATSAPPDVPVLLLSGRLDLRTPLGNAQAVARLFPRAQIVEVPGTGHDEVDSDYSGCVETALRRFAAGRRVGAPCRGASNQIEPLERAPRSLAGLPQDGVAGRRGQIVAGVAMTVRDARASALQSLFGGFTGVLQGGGLRGGSFHAAPRGAGLHISLDRYAYVPGLRVSGRLRLSDGAATGRVRVDAPGRGGDGTVTFGPGGAITGRLGGQRVRVPVARRDARQARDASAAAAGPPAAGELPLGRDGARLRDQARRHVRR